MRLLTVLILLVLSSTAAAQEAATSRGILADTFDGALGDSWSPYISVTGMLPLKPMGEVAAELDGGAIEDMAMTAPGIFEGQLGTYVSTKGIPWHFRMSLGFTYAPVNSDIGSATLFKGGFEVMPFYQLGSHRLGAGIGIGLLSRLDTTDMGGETLNLGRPITMAAEYGFFVSVLRSWINLRYQQTTYEIGERDQLVFGSGLNDQSVGVGFSFQFL